jgi:hypothetical protein
MKITLPPEIETRTIVLTDRATSLRAQAETLPDLLAQTYRRRAAELELEAWATELRAGGLVEPAAA